MKLLYFFFISSSLIASTYDDLLSNKIIEKGSVPKLHLGCGQHPIDTYVNIDFPLSEHSVQVECGADFTHDITKLSFAKGSIKEVRNHHVFEHFSRPVALAMLTAWHYWLCEGGSLHIETPDFENGIKHFLKEKSYEKKQGIMRHLFGSHEEHWAVHWDGWYRAKYSHILSQLGFEEIRIKEKNHKLLDNIRVIATKTRSYSLEELRKRGKEVLKESMVDECQAEKDLWEVWCKSYDQALDAMTICTITQ